MSDLIRNVYLTGKVLQMWGKGWCAGVYLKPDRTIRELGMFDNYSIDLKNF